MAELVTVKRTGCMKTKLEVDHPYDLLGNLYGILTAENINQIRPYQSAFVLVCHVCAEAYPKNRPGVYLVIQETNRYVVLAVKPAGRQLEDLPEAYKKNNQDFVRAHRHQGGDS